MNKFIRTDIKDEVGVITLDRPDVLNALNREMVDEIVAAMENFDQNEEAKVIVIKGNGKAFVAGADIDEMADDDSIRMELLNQFAVWDRISLIKKPVIAAVHGFALGGGFELALSCDIIFASEKAQMGFPEVKLGVMPGAGGTQRLTKAMGKAKALEWLWLGDPMEAKEAMHYGVINRIIPEEALMEETMTFAKKLTKQAPLSLRLIKESVNKAVDSTIYDGMQFERKNFYLLFSSLDQKEGMQAFIEKRLPNFEGR
ncbi:enoyl-CoA hydratase/isomerase family protein [Virgibacillus alimentarius]|uniref:Enoyl-CoA hydratase n=1 Tax=Virgibacillus alimentarius TaxID=698769 RepID=A0ABS4SA27_9BACI|nr:MULTISPECIES: enoyl-CoA hydratase-related protein [Virgibacillus]MBP2258348.1 enoyl-CoA hydratase [Virgibacillus alimentarius]HLR67956.1 enoyl-CoA hydratase-related protein [Virgibacillus sp.]